MFERKMRLLILCELLSKPFLILPTTHIMHVRNS